MVLETLFRTTVQTSVQESMQTGKPLFVYLSDESEQSTTFVNRLLPHESDLVQKVETCFIAVKLIENTVDYGFFQQIFTDISTPSFYIVSQGQILDIIHKDTTEEEFKQKMAKYKAKETPAVSTDMSTNSNISRDPTNQSVTSEVSTNSTNISRPPTNQSVTPEPSKPIANTKIERPAQEQSVKRHQAEVKALNKQKQQEKDRLRALINADKKERLSQQKALEIKEPVPEKPQLSTSFKTCSLAIKLFDGSSIIHDFDALQTLNDVRSWLDTETEIIPDTSSLPSFASHTGPTHYVFHRPTIPRATFTDEQEFIKLAELDLCPRSALILKPIFTDVVSAYPKEKGSVFKSIYGATSTVASALYSFFDYGVDQMHEVEADANENIISDSTNSGSDHRNLRDGNSGAATPSILSISDSRANMSSLINIEDSRLINSHPQSPNIIPQTFDSNHGTPLISRVGTPISRIQTVHTLDGDDDKQNTYNGNSVNLNPNKKDEKQE